MDLLANYVPSYTVRESTLTYRKIRQLSEADNCAWYSTRQGTKLCLIEKDVKPQMNSLGNYVQSYTMRESTLT
jgi:hypothetical protein